MSDSYDFAMKRSRSLFHLARLECVAELDALIETTKRGLVAIEEKTGIYKVAELLLAVSFMMCCCARHGARYFKVESSALSPHSQLPVSATQLHASAGRSLSGRSSS